MARDDAHVDQIEDPSVTLFNPSEHGRRTLYDPTGYDPYGLNPYQYHGISSILKLHLAHFSFNNWCRPPTGRALQSVIVGPSFVQDMKTVDEEIADLFLVGAVLKRSDIPQRQTFRYDRLSTITPTHYRPWK